MCTSRVQQPSAARPVALQRPRHRARHAARNGNTCRGGARLAAVQRPSAESWPHQRATRQERPVAGTARHGYKMLARRRRRSPRSAARCCACAAVVPVADDCFRLTGQTHRVRGQETAPGAPLTFRSRHAAPRARLVCPPRPSLRCRVRSDAMLLSVRSRPPGTVMLVVMPGSYVTASGAQPRAQTNRY
jgi:hypothetical protein